MVDSSAHKVKLMRLANAATVAGKMDIFSLSRHSYLHLSSLKKKDFFVCIP